MGETFEKYIRRALMKQGLIPVLAVAVISLVFAFFLIWSIHANITKTTLTLGQSYSKTLVSHINNLINLTYIPEFKHILEDIKSKGKSATLPPNIKLYPYAGHIDAPTITHIVLLTPELSIKLEGITNSPEGTYRVEYYKDSGPIIRRYIGSIIKTIGESAQYISGISIYDSNFDLINGNVELPSEIKANLTNNASRPIISSNPLGMTYIIFPIHIPRVENGTLYMAFTIRERDTYAVSALIIAGILLVIVLTLLVTSHSSKQIAHYLAQPLTELANIVQNMDIRNSSQKEFLSLDTLCQGKPMEICVLAEKLEELYERNRNALEQVKREQEKRNLAYEHASKKEQELYDAYYNFATTLATIAERHDDTTGKHIKRVGEIAGFIAEKMGLHSILVDQIRKYAPLHDIGKIMIPDNILQKTGALTEEEWELMKKHTIYGAELIGDQQYFMVARNIALYHHERYDGSGYPFGLKGNQIPIEAQITAIADVYDALRSKRPYKPALTHEEALKILLEGDSHTKPDHFNPKILDVLKGYHTYIRDIYDSLI